MNRRRFIELLTSATIGSTVAYSFPSIVVPKNISIEFVDLLNKMPVWLSTTSTPAMLYNIQETRRTITRPFWKERNGILINVVKG